MGNSSPLTRHINTRKGAPSPVTGGRGGVGWGNGRGNGPGKVVHTHASTIPFTATAVITVQRNHAATKHAYTCNNTQRNVVNVITLTKQINHRVELCRRNMFARYAASHPVVSDHP